MTCIRTLYRDFARLGVKTKKAFIVPHMLWVLYEIASIMNPGNVGLTKIDLINLDNSGVQH